MSGAGRGEASLMEWQQRRAPLSILTGHVTQSVETFWAGAPSLADRTTRSVSPGGALQPEWERSGWVWK